MQELISDPSFAIYVGAAIVLSLNMLGLGNATALSRTKAGEVVNPEDKKLNAEASVVFDEGNDATTRYRRAHRNALENVPLFLTTGLILVLVGVSQTVAGILFGVFTVARILHSVCYVKGVQPFRTVFFAAGMLTQVAVLVFIAYGVFFAG